jgi:hypothetical protein
LVYWILLQIPSSEAEEHSLKPNWAKVEASLVQVLKSAVDLDWNLMRIPF